MAAATRHVRIAGDLADMLGWIIRVEGGTAADELDPLIRAAVVQRYAAIKPAVERLLKTKRRKERVR